MILIFARNSWVLAPIKNPFLCLLYSNNELYIGSRLKGLLPMTKEADIQIACNQYLDYLAKTYNFRHFHVPNEGKRSIHYHAKMKKMGLRSGCPDIIVEYPVGRILYIELKAPKGRLSDTQKLWAVQSEILGTPHYIVKGGVNECLDIVGGIIKQNIPIR